MTEGPAFQAPQLLSAAHNIASFRCGEPTLDSWLQKRALKNNEIDASRTFVVTVEGGLVVGFIALSVGSISHSAASGALKRDMPDPIPVAILARLGVHEDYQGRGLGRSLVREAVLRSLQASSHVALKGIVVHALHGKPRAFYEAFGFQRSHLDELTLMAPLKSLRQTLGLES